MIMETCHFTTNRLTVQEWHSAPLPESQDLTQVVMALLTPKTTQSLPDEWRGAYTTERATNWIQAQGMAGTTLLVASRISKQPVGLMILFETDDPEQSRTIRLGYLLAESEWGKGLASELVEGFVDWCKSHPISSIIAGVEKDNHPSRRVLEKNGFSQQPAEEMQETLFYEHKF